MMLAVDTNVLARYLNNDHPVQSKRAAAIVSGQDIFIAKSVVLELEWVLRACYGLGPKTVLDSLRALLGLPNVAMEDGLAVAGALAAYESGMDFADALHLQSSREAERFVTFDKKLCKKAAKSSGSVGMAVECL